MRMKALRVISAISALCLLASCYLPNKFSLVMQVAPDGRYAVTYDGTLTQLQFLQRLGTGEITEDTVDHYVAIYESEMRRNSGFQEVSYLGNAEYQVTFEKQGNLAEERQFSFPIRKGVLLGLRRWTPETAAGYFQRFEQLNHPALPALMGSGFQQEPNVMEIFGDRLPAKVRADLQENGFWTQGTIRIWTSAKVGYHNAASVVEGNPSLYVWEVSSLEDPPPQMIMAWTPMSTN